MADLKMTLACWNYDRTRALMDGSVKPEGIELTYHNSFPAATFHRMMGKREFEASELGLTFYLDSLHEDDPPFVGRDERRVDLAVHFRELELDRARRESAHAHDPRRRRDEHASARREGQAAVLFQLPLIGHEFLPAKICGVMVEQAGFPLLLWDLPPVVGSQLAIHQTRAHLGAAVAADRSGSRRLGDEAAALIIAHRLHSDSARLGEARDRQVFHA